LHCSAPCAAALVVMKLLHPDIVQRGCIFEEIIKKFIKTIKQEKFQFFN